jgi:hypothetical protein
MTAPTELDELRADVDELRAELAWLHDAVLSESQTVRTEMARMDHELADLAGES